MKPMARFDYEASGMSIEEFERHLKKAIHSQRYARRKAERYGVRVDPILAHLIDVLHKGTRCYWCGKHLPFDKRTIDHVVPMCKGGGHVIGNVVVSCVTCNGRKGDMSKMEYMEFRRTGKRPT